MSESQANIHFCPSQIGDKLSVSQTRSLFIRRRLFVSEQDTDTVSTFPPVYSRRANRCCFCWVIENYSVTLFNGHKNSIFLGCWGNSCDMGRAAQVRLMPSMFILIECFLTILLYCGKVLHHTAQLLLTVLLFIFSSFHINSTISKSSSSPSACCRIYLLVKVLF